MDLTEKRFILADSFRGFHPWLVGPVAFRLVTREHIMVGSAWIIRATHLIAARKQRKSSRL
jgi:hypothetical protein